MKFLKTRRWSAPLGLSILAATVAVSAQNPPQRPKPTPQTPIFRSGTDLVYTDVRVQDASNRFIPDLTVEDFEVYEDGVLQTVSNFVAMVGGRAMSEIVPEVEPVREGLIMPPRARAPTTTGRIFIVFIDDLHLQPLDSIKAKAVLKLIRDTVLHEDDLVGLVSSGYSSVSFDLNPDPKRLRFNQAIEKTMGAGKTPLEIIQAAQTVEGPSGLRADAFTAFRTAYDILDQAEKVTNRRKAFIYLSSGYDFNPFTESRYKAEMDRYASPPLQSEIERQRTGSDPISGLADSAGTVFRNPFEMNGLQFASADLAAALGELVRRARRANVVFYPVDPRGLVAGPDIGTPLSMEEWSNYVNNSLSSLDTIAGETGGFCLCRNNDFKKGLQRLDNEMSDYYIIGYESNNPDPLKVMRRIEIKVKRPGAQKPIYKDWYSLKRK